MGEMQNDDLNLLHEYARHNSEDAFAVLVARHVNLVYSVALRSVRDPHLAEEATQAVFIILARKAGGFNDRIILSGWLCRTARYAAANIQTIQRRRREREQEAHMQTMAHEPEPETWTQIAPVLDEAMEKLGQKDHDALVLRFFENRSFAEAGAALGVSEAAAKMRVGRALEKLHHYFHQHGISSTTAIIGSAISANSIQAAPVALAKTAAAVSFAKGMAASSSTLTLVKGAMKVMAWSNAKSAMVLGAAAVVLILGTTGGIVVVYEHDRPVAITPENVVDRLRAGHKSDYFPRSSWLFAGYNDPKSTVMSTLWAVRERNVAAIVDCGSPDLQQQARQGFASQTPGQAVSWPEFVIENAAPLTNVEGFYFMGQQQITTDTVAVQLFVTNDVRIEYAFLLKQTGSGWKLEEFRK